MAIGIPAQHRSHAYGRRHISVTVLLATMLVVSVLSPLLSAAGTYKIFSPLLSTAASAATMGKQVILCDGRTFDGFGSPPFHLEGAQAQDASIQKVIRNCTFRNAKQSAIRIAKARNVLIENSQFINLRSGQPGVDLNAISISCGTGNHGTSCNEPGTIDTIIIRNNTFDRIGADGIQIGSNSHGSRNIYIEGNTFTGYADVGENGIDIKGTDGPVYVRSNTFRGFRPCESPKLGGTQDCSGSQTGAALVVHDNSVNDPAKNVTVSGNVFYNNDMSIGVGKTSTGTTISNNEIRDNLRWGIRVNEQASDVQVNGNRFANNGARHVQVTNTVSGCTQWGNTFSGQGSVSWGSCVKQ